MKAGRFRFEIETAGAASLVLQTVLPILATAGEGSRVEVSGGTHVPSSPSASYLRRPWAGVVARLGLRIRVELVRAGFYPRGGGELRAEVEPWTRGASLGLERRGALVGLAGESGAGRLKGDVARRGWRTLFSLQRADAVDSKRKLSGANKRFLSSRLGKLPTKHSKLRLPDDQPHSSL